MFFSEIEKILAKEFDDEVAPDHEISQESKDVGVSGKLGLH
jgi:hypothetical protein